MITRTYTAYHYLTLFYLLKVKRIKSVLRDVIQDNAIPAVLVGTSLTVGIRWITEYASPIVALIGGVLGLVILFLTIREKIANYKIMDMEREERTAKHEEWHKKHDKNK